MISVLLYRLERMRDVLLYADKPFIGIYSFDGLCDSRVSHACTTLRTACMLFLFTRLYASDSIAIPQSALTYWGMCLGLVDILAAEIPIV